MALKDLTLQFPEETITFKAGSFVVGGLSLQDILILVSFHKERLNELVAEFSTKESGALVLDPERGIDFGLSLFQMAPTLAAHIIAQAEVREQGEAPNFAVAVKLPADVQIEALDKILNLTFQTEGGPKKVWEIVKRAFVGTIKFTADLAT